MHKITQFMSGKKANMSAAWMFAGAVALLMNGAQVNTETGEIILNSGNGEMATLLTALSVALATLRASISKIAVQFAKNAPIIIGGTLMGLYAVGCATLGDIDPNTGQPFSEGIQNEIVSLAPLFGPVLSTIIPIVTGSALNIATIIGQMMSSSSSDT